MRDKERASDPARFSELGFVVVPSFFTHSDLRVIAKRVNAIVSAPAHAGMNRPADDRYPLRWDDEIVAFVLGSARHRDLLDALLRPADLKWLSGCVAVKRARMPAEAWHQEWWCWDHPLSFQPRTAQITLLCYLTDTTPQNGALRVLPTSHHRSFPIHRMLAETADIQSGGAAMDVPEQVTLAVQAGDAVVLDSRLLRGAHANETLTRRDCISLSFALDWQGLPPEIKAHLSGSTALPSAKETKQSAGSGYADLLAAFDAGAVSVSINRRPPPEFAMQAKPGL